MATSRSVPEETRHINPLLSTETKTGAELQEGNFDYLALTGFYVGFMQVCIGVKTQCSTRGNVGQHVL